MAEHNISNEQHYFPISSVAEILYCPRNFYYRVVEGAEDSNHHLLEGKLQEERRDERQRLVREGYRQDRSIHVSSEKLNLYGIVDIVEQGKEIYPVEYKKGFRKESLNDDVQVCAQAMALEEKLGQDINRGYIYYAGSKARREVIFDEDLRLMVENAVGLARNIALSGEIPPPLADNRCEGCALVNRCLPFEVKGIKENKAKAVRPQPGINLGRVLYVDEQGASLYKKGERVLVTKDQIKFKDIPLCNLDQVVLVGNVNLSSQLIKLFLGRGTEVHFISTKGKYYGCLQAALSKNSVLRIAQHRAYQKQEERLLYASEFVRGKLSNMRTNLLRYNRSLNNHSIDEAVSRIKNIIKRLEKAKDLNELMGLEGAGSRDYFSVFGLLIKDRVPFDFNKRSRRPPEDPANALLSFSYSLLLKDVITAVQVVGFDPFIGFLHRSDFGRPALALDIIEEFRPVVADSVVLTALNKGVIAEGDFEYRMGGCFLSETGRKKMYRLYEERRKEMITHPVFGYRISYLRTIELQARFLAKVLTKEIDGYKPFLVR
ncbi:CRISPR-associated protein, Cas1 family / CRISPR-associated exonuclease, Cas4 family [Desulforamulus reducens MI-1]|uniref:CRISPR-associated endonuclease Cas1 n=1 Tax=Desulforamulus reducens (strain ATCC BAA-1160 / DSM 100696 / MI-1) TaxID=349161 RepID=A4J500_DESRM|nr:CRISPR-associated endonuclease Cas4/Cas1 [Desulforamulus reducens]ABO50153.1 CRISPR-associated protein, Cas1 family / CRISPR-associated exonuclease, Cas4 family [Desulforamulus reducens MI-1]